MTITVRFFASLRESMDCREVEVDAAHAGTAGDAWRLATGGRPIPEITVTSGATEGLFSTLTALVRSGDEVAFFPPVTGG